MLNLSDKDIDRLSREAAEKYEVQQDPSAWHKLEQLLDKEMGRPSPFPKFSGRGMPFLYTSAAILLISLTYFLLKPAKHTTTSTQKNYPSTLKQAVTSDASRQPSLPNKGAVKDEQANRQEAGIKNSESGIKAKDKEADNAKNDALKNAPLMADKNASSGKAVIKEYNKENEKPGEVLKTVKGSVNEDRPPLIKPGADVKNNDVVSKTGTKANKKGHPDALNNVPGKKQTVEKNEGDIQGASTVTDKANAGKTFEKDNKKEISETDATAKSIENKNNNNLNGSVNRKNKSGKNGLQHKDKAGKTEGDQNVPGYAVKDNDQKTEDNPVINEPKPATINGLQLLGAYPGPVINDRAATALQIHAAAIQQDIVNPMKKNNGRVLRTNRSLQIGFLYSPDFSQVKYNYNNRIGSNIGITIGYQLSGTLSVNTGLIYTHKEYATTGHDFHLPANCGIDQANLDFVNGNCYMYEIPLNLRYDFSKEGNTSFFINGGLSSYIMKKENYGFYLHDNIGYARLQHNTYETNQGYWLSILNLSAGLETKISNSFSIQAEPFLKLPLTGIGFGKVDLSSYGMNISIKYSPILSRSRR